MTLFRASIRQVLGMAMVACIFLVTSTTTATKTEQEVAILVTRRGLDWTTPVLQPQQQASSSSSASSSPPPACNFSGTITLACPSSLDHTDAFYAIGSRQLAAYQLVIDRINQEQCGVALANHNTNTNTNTQQEQQQRQQYALELITWDDASDANRTFAIAQQHMQPQPTHTSHTNMTTTNNNNNPMVVDLWLGGYSSGLTEVLAARANDTQRLVLAPGAAQTNVLADRPTVFGTLPPASQYFATALQGLHHVGAHTLALVWEDQSFPTSACAGAAQWAHREGMTVTSQHRVAANPHPDRLVHVARQLANEQPDVVLTCVYDRGCRHWMHALRTVDWAPKAQVLTVCVGMESLVEDLGSDVDYLLGVTPWDVATHDAATHWSAADFRTAFRRHVGGGTVPYQAAAAAAAVSIAVQAMRATQTVDNAVLVDYIARHEFDTLYGKVNFDEHGQNQAPSLLIQYHANRTLQVVWPPEGTTANNRSASSLVYPMPSWAQRDCRALGQCEPAAGTCQYDGTCDCADPTATARGVGEQATCIVYQDHLLTKGVIVFGYVAVAISWALSSVVLAWILRHRRWNVIKVAQMEFLCLIGVGAMISTSTIIAISFQAGTGDDTTRASMGCTAAPFLYAIGWTLMFSSLCAKTFRLHVIMKNCASGKQGQVVTVASTLYIVVFALVVDMAIVIAWTVTNPLVYKRVELGQGVDLETGIVFINSVGFCSSRDENGPGMWAFAGPLIGFHLLLVLVTGFFLFKVRTMKDRYQESRYISFAMLLMLEVLIVGIPVAVAVSDLNASHVVLIGVVAIHDIGILSFIFLPKIFFQKNVTEEETHEQTEDLILASLQTVSSSKFGDAVAVIDDLLKPNSTTRESMTEEQSSQLRNVKAILMQKNDTKESKMLHVPSQLYKGTRSASSARATTNSNTKGTLRYILREFGGVTDNIMGDEPVRSSHPSMRRQNSRGTLDSAEINGAPTSDVDCPEAAGFYTLPEFENLLNDSQRKNMFHLLTWSNLKRWDFNIFDIMKVTGEHPLLFVGWAILGSPYAQFSMAKACGYEDVSLCDFQGYNFMESSMKVPLRKLCDYLRVIEHDYNDDNPYHNAIHAADVLQTVHSLIQMKASEFDDDEELFSVLLAAAIHDVKHPGKNNAFQVNAQTDIALVYNDASVLENKHAAHAFMLMLGSDPDQPSDSQDPIDRHGELNILAKVKPRTFARIRKRVVEAVLNTDMSQHFATVDAMKALVAESVDGRFPPERRWEILMYLLHMADISNPAKGDPFFKIWADRCLDEFFAQGDMEKDMGLPISPNCNRKTTEKADSQLGFINFVIKPSFEVLGLIIPAVRERILPVIDNNVEYWKAEKDKKESV